MHALKAQFAARHVLHAVSAWDASSCVGRTMLRALSLADRLGLRTLAFPALGTGAARVRVEADGFFGRKWSLEEIQQLLGHEDIETTQRYAHALQETLNEAARSTWGENRKVVPPPPAQGGDSDPSLIPRRSGTSPKSPR